MPPDCPSGASNARRPVWPVRDAIEAETRCAQLLGSRQPSPFHCVPTARCARVPTGRDGDEEQGDFASFPPWPTKRQTSLLPVRGASFPYRRGSDSGDDDGAALRRDDGVLVLHGGRLGLGPEGETILG